MAIPNSQMYAFVVPYKSLLQACHCFSSSYELEVNYLMPQSSGLRLKTEKAIGLEVVAEKIRVAKTWRHATLGLSKRGQHQVLLIKCLLRYHKDIRLYCNRGTRVVDEASRDKEEQVLWCRTSLELVGWLLGNQQLLPWRSA